MIIGINLPQRGFFVGLVQRFVGFSSLLLGFTLNLNKFQTKLKTPMKSPLRHCPTAPPRLCQAKVLFEPQTVTWPTPPA